MTPEKTRVGIIGLGYVGLSTAVCFASKGIKTIGLDIDAEKLSLIGRGKAPFAEEGLTALLSRSIRRKTLILTEDYGAAAEGSDILFITVGTPSLEDGSLDTSWVESASKSLGKAVSRANRYKLVVVKSTVTPGTTESIVKPLIERESGKKLGEFGLAANPEFLREGSAVRDTFAPDRIVIGAADTKSKETLLSFYGQFYGKRLPRTVITTPANGELIKYASNAFLATKISFVNEIANLCNKIPGADVKVVAEGMGLDKRIAPCFLNAGLGWGGSCFGKDIRALLSFTKAAGAELPISNAALETNVKQPLVAVELAHTLIGNLKGKRVALLGLSFKPGTDDMRDAVSIPIVERLLKEGAHVISYDPAAMANAKALLGERVEYAGSAKECLRGADCCILITEWAVFSRLRPDSFKRLMRTPALVDGRRGLEGERFLKAGVKFATVGLSRL